MKKFSADNVEHVLPVIDVIRPPTGYKDPEGQQQ